jgi:hypothetical protein
MSYTKACGLSSDEQPDLSLPPRVRDCMAQAGRERIAYLRAYSSTLSGPVAQSATLPAPAVVPTMTAPVPAAPFPDSYPGETAPGNAGPEWDRRHPVEAQHRRDDQAAKERREWEVSKAAPLTEDEKKAVRIKQEMEAELTARIPTDTKISPGTAAIYALFMCTGPENCTHLLNFPDLESCRKQKREFDSNFPKNQENFIKSGSFHLQIYICASKSVPVWEMR